ncbi:MAG: Uroporphyrinogen decarboxylase (URO-D) [candidate division TA06 bacterium ADurb.Bin417]|uniref:Uroporphyrinogen decarboxylase (URO-D) n=1 Tax=candidate division TA06 bacterium ADurb.Bin417 TaxID=1852828 RepID=A0A1V5MHP4_UNCT6|nr:MAG: Uroporphyrinogen decarboxylase (URO-D) [candidate division TA06 bacterium ADurb.Bin417]
METLGIQPETTKPQVNLGVNFDLMPAFEEKILEHRDGHYLMQTIRGEIVEVSDRYDFTYLRSAKDFVTRKYHRHPVENRADWDAMKKRFNPDTPGRFPEDFEVRCRQLADRDYVLRIWFNGPFWQLRNWCGFENLCLFMAEDPELVEEMALFWRDFIMTILDRIFARVAPDHFGFSEDMAYKAKSMISPAMARRFLMPCWQTWSAAARRSGCRIIDVDSDGYIGELIPLWIESGINSCQPIEVAAGNDLPAYRKQFGRSMAYHGGIDKRAIAKGGAVIEAELQRVIPPMLVDGGYVPSCDHGVPPDISWADFIHYSRELAKLTGWL